MDRRDKVRQAVSLWRALQTRRWRLEHDPGDRRPAILHYRFEGINHLVQAFHQEDRDWDEFFSARGVSPLSIVYEQELNVDLDRTVHKALRYLGVAAPARWRGREPIKRQADATSEDWVAKYHRDAAQRGGDQNAVGVAAI